MEPAAHVRSRELPLGAGRCPLQSLQQHSPIAAAGARRSAPLPAAPPAAGRAPGPGHRGPARGLCPVGRGAARGAAGPAAPCLLRSAPAPRRGHNGLRADPANQ